MPTFPLDLASSLGHWEQYLVYLLIGIGFGIALEVSGFGVSTRLAGQFYFRDQTVLKVMFSAIVVAMVLVFGATALGLLDYNMIWVNPTYLIPGIVGGLIMGVGFIIGGFCPGTSLVAAATLKLDGIFFTLGALFGIFIFGESVGVFEEFWNSTYMGRFTLPQLFGVDTGIIVVGVVIMALVMFFGAELLEQRFGKKDRKLAPKWRYGAGGTLLAMAGVVFFVGQPSSATRWSWVEAEEAPRLEKRAVMVSPAEVLNYMYSEQITMQLVDIRSASDFDTFHIDGAQHIASNQLLSHLPEWQVLTGNNVIILMGNDETASIEAWKMLVSENIANVYILDGGINRWIDMFDLSSDDIEVVEQEVMDDQLGYQFPAGVDFMPLARPNPSSYGPFDLEYTPRIELQGKKGATGGGCG
jgi:rhodanese-related sulfurtransferase